MVPAGRFPEAFENEKFYDLSPLLPSLPFPKEAVEKAGFFYRESFFIVRLGGKYSRKAFLLSRECHWDILEDDEGLLVLVPTKRQ